MKWCLHFSTVQLHTEKLNMKGLVNIGHHIRKDIIYALADSE